MVALFSNYYTTEIQARVGEHSAAWAPDRPDLRGAPRELTTGGEWRGCGMYFLPTYLTTVVTYPNSPQGFCKLLLLLPSPLLDLGSTGAELGFCIVVVVCGLILTLQ